MKKTRLRDKMSEQHKEYFFISRNLLKDTGSWTGLLRPRDATRPDEVQLGADTDLTLEALPICVQHPREQPSTATTTTTPAVNLRRPVFFVRVPQVTQYATTVYLGLHRVRYCK